MIGVTSSEGWLRITAEIKTPSAEGGQWTPARVGRLTELLEKLIKDYVEAAELVDDVARTWPKWRYPDATTRCSSIDSRPGSKSDR